MSMNKPAFAPLLASLTALALAAPALAQQNGSVRDFELPTGRNAPQQERAQGPVVEGVPAPRVARPAPTPVAVPPVVEVEVPPSETTPRDPFAAIDAMGQRRPTPAPQSTAAVAAGEAAPVATDAATSPVGVIAQPTIDLPRPTTPQSAAVAAPMATPSPAGHIAWWVWLLAVVAVGAVGTAAGWIWRGRRTEVFLLPPPIERPKVPERAPKQIGPPAELPRAPAAPRTPQPLPVAAVEEEDEEHIESPLRIALEPARLSVSLLNATLSYRLLLTNQGDHALRDISIDGDMVSAHASLSQAEQLAAPNSKLENRHLLRVLSPGETKVVTGDFALPLPLIRPIRKGDATLFVPLARLRIVSGGENTQVVVQTSVVGQRSPRPGGGLRPFRLDLGPRIYSELGQRAFA